MARGSKEAAFLPPAYEEEIASARGLVNNLEFPADPDATLTRQLVPYSNHVLSVATEQQNFLAAEGAILPEITSPEDQKKHFQYAAVVRVLQDLKLLSVKHLVSIQTGVAKAEGQDAAVAKGFEIGAKLIDFRARTTVTNLLQASDTLDGAFVDAGLVYPVLERARQINENKRKSVGMNVTSEEWQEYLALQQQADDAARKPPAKESGIKASRHKLINRMRVMGYAAKLTRKHDKNSGLASIEMIDEAAGQAMSTITEPLDLDNGQLRRAVQINAGVMKVVKTAARHDPVIRRDPRAQYALYLYEALGGQDIRAETAVFERDVQKSAAKEKRLKNG